MDKITRYAIQEVGYHAILSKLLTPSFGEGHYPHHVRYRVILLLSLTTGLPLKHLLTFTWEDILTIDGKDQPQIKSDIRSGRNYLVPIGKAIQARLSSSYNVLNQPPLKSMIIESEIILESLFLPFALAMDVYIHKEMTMDDVKSVVHLPEILFGRRVMELLHLSGH